MLGSSGGGSFSVSTTLSEDVHKAYNRRMERKAVIPLCTSPRVFDALGLPRADIVTQSHVITKLRKKHKLSEKEIIDGIKGLDDPLFVFRDFRSDDIIIFPGMLAKNNDGKQGDVMAPIQLEKMRDGKHYMASLYPLDSLDKVKAMLKRGNLLYSKNKKEVLRRANSYAPELSPDLLRLLVEENLWKKNYHKRRYCQAGKRKKLRRKRNRPWKLWQLLCNGGEAGAGLRGGAGRRQRARHAAQYGVGARYCRAQR